MKLNFIRLGCALSTVWALWVFLVGLSNLFWSGCGVEFLGIVDCFDPGFHYAKWGFGGVIVATLYAAIDGWVVGVVFAWLYNLYTKGKRE